MLNPNYRPVTDDDVNILREKQQFMHDVFDKTLHTDRVKKFVREHEGDYDAKACIKSLIHSVLNQLMLVLVHSLN